MAKVVTGKSFSEDDQSTHISHNQAWTESTFDASAVDDVSIQLDGSGSMQLKPAGGGDGVLATHIAAGAVTLSKMASNSVDSDQYVDASIDNAHLNPASGTAAVAGSGGAGSGTNVIEASSIGFADLDPDVITGQTLLEAFPHPTEDSFMISDNGTLKELFFAHLPMPRAWGRIDFTTAAATTVLGGYHVNGTVTDDGVYSGSYEKKTVTFSGITMVDSNYVVTVSWGGHAIAGTSTPSVITMVRATTTLQIASLVESGAYVDFVVHGALSGYSPT